MRVRCCFSAALTAAQGSARVWGGSNLNLPFSSPSLAGPTDLFGKEAIVADYYYCFVAAERQSPFLMWVCALPCSEHLEMQGASEGPWCGGTKQLSLQPPSTSAFWAPGSSNARSDGPGLS